MRSLRRTLESALVPPAALVLLVWPCGAARASDIPLGEVRAPTARERDLDTVREAISDPEVAGRLAQAGVDPGTLLDRVERMTPAETRYLAGRIRAEERAGGSVAGAIAAIVIVGLLVFLILVLADKVDLGTSHARTDVKGEDPLRPGAVLG